MNRIVRLACWSLAVAVSADCSLLGPEPSLDGEWTAQAGHSGYFGLSLQQSGDVVTGRACAFESGVRMYANAPVTGNHPNLHVTVTDAAVGPCCAHMVGQAWSARIEDRGEIVTPSGLRFRRSAEPACPAE